MRELPIRKDIRLKGYDYASANAYFITICTDKRKEMFWREKRTGNLDPRSVPLSDYGEIVDRVIREIPEHYPSVSLDHYVVMPDHIHLLIQIHSDASGRQMAAPMPNVSKIIQQMKGTASKRAGFSLWQKGFYDHIIRSDKDYWDTWYYIEQNPMT